MYSARSARIRTMPPRSPISWSRNWSRLRVIPRWWRSARRGSTIITTTARATCRRRASARISPPRARPDCRSSSMPARRMPTSRACSRRRAREGRVSLRAALLHRAGRSCAHRGLALGGYISFSGVVTFKSAEALRDIALAVPSDRLLVETDAPLSCARADARQDQRAGLRRAHRGAARGLARRARGGDGAY